ncbi:hypothetical protein RAS1_38330 [Phycisphaerae bacterium RAS1]|nr:hypothetical protein RAS1_38330 [Phycisphaerae bacterium RAS1]
MSTHCKKAVQKASALMCVYLLVGMAHGATSYTFTANGGASGDWNSAMNWSPSTGYPGSGDTAIIPNGKTCLVEQSNQTCSTVNINSGGILLVKGRDLAIESEMQINGDLQFKSVNNVPGRILKSSAITLSGAGLVDARAANSLGRGEFNGSGGYLTIGSDLTVTGSIDFNCSINVNGTIKADGTDTMNVGVTRHASVNGQGNFIADGESEIAFLDADLTPGFTTTRKLWVKAGTIRLSSTADCNNAIWWIVIDGGGKFVVETDALFVSALTFSSGKIRVAAEKTFVVDPEP